MLFLRERWARWRIHGPWDQERSRLRNSQTLRRSLSLPLSLALSLSLSLPLSLSLCPSLSLSLSLFIYIHTYTRARPPYNVSPRNAVPDRDAFSFWRFICRPLIHPRNDDYSAKQKSQPSTEIIKIYRASRPRFLLLTLITRVLRSIFFTPARCFLSCRLGSLFLHSSRQCVAKFFLTFLTNY